MQIYMQDLMLCACNIQMFGMFYIYSTHMQYPMFAVQKHFFQSMSALQINFHKLRNIVKYLMHARTNLSMGYKQMFHNFLKSFCAPF